MFAPSYSMGLLFSPTIPRSGRCIAWGKRQTSRERKRDGDVHTLKEGTAKRMANSGLDIGSAEVDGRMAFPYTALLGLFCCYYIGGVKRPDERHPRKNLSILVGRRKSTTTPDNNKKRPVYDIL